MSNLYGSSNSSLYNTAPAAPASSGLYSFNNAPPAANPGQPRGGPPRGAPGGPPRGAGGPPRGGSNQSDSPARPASPNPARGAPMGPPRGAGGPPRGGPGGPPRGGGSNQSDSPGRSAPQGSVQSDFPSTPNARGAPQSRGAPPPGRGAPPNRGAPASAAPASSGLYSTGNYTSSPTPTPPNPASSGLYNTTNYSPKPKAPNPNPAATSGLYATGPRVANPPPSNPASSGLYASANQLGSVHPPSKTVNALVETPASRPPQLQTNQSSGNIARTRAGVANMVPVRPVATAPPTPTAPKPNEPIELSDYNWCFKAIRGENLAAKDANGLSDPYLVVELFIGTENNGEWTVSKTMHKTITPVVKETLNPEWNFDAFVLNADQAWGKFNGVKITCMDKDLVGADDFMGEVYLGFDVDIPGPPSSKKIQVNVKPRPKKKDKVSGFLVFESSFQPVPGSAADTKSAAAGPGTLRRNQSQSSLKSAAIQKSSMVQISATGRREIKVTSTLQGGYITYGELPPFEIDGDGANQTKNERKYGYNSNLAMWMVTCCQLAYRNDTIAGEVARNVWDMYDFHFIDNEQTDTQGFCMHNDKFIVVCFRGTESIRDWMTNLNFLMCANPQYPQRYLKAGVRVHTGFSEALSSVWPEIEAFVTKAYRSFPGLKLYICGHSLGGALANLCFSYFVLSDRPRPVAAVYTVGQPRAGNKKFKEQLELAAPNTCYIRVTNNQDCVPSLAGGQHCGVHLHITATGSFTFDPPTWRKAVTKAQSIQGSAASLNYGGLQDHGTHVYRKRIEAHWIKLQMAKAASNDGAFDLCEQALFIMDLLTEDIKAVRRYKPQFRAILAQVIKLRPLIEAVQDYLGGGVDPRSRHKLKELLATFFELLSKLRKQVIARHSKKSVLQSAGKNSAKAFNEKMTKEARAFQTVSDGINNTLKSAQLVPQTSSLYSWAEASTVTKWTGAEYDVSFNSIDFFAISAATKAKAGEVTHVSKLIEAVEAMVEDNKLEPALQSLNAITSGSGSVGALSPEDQVLVAFLTAKIHAKLHHHNEALSALQSVSNTGLMNSAMFGDSAFTTLKNQAGFAALQQNWASASVQSSDDEALVAKMNNFEIHSLSRLFDDADDNGDNFLTTEEFQGLLQSNGLDEILDNLGWAEEGVDKTPILNGILADMRRKYHNAADLDQFISLMARLMPR